MPQTSRPSLGSPSAGDDYLPASGNGGYLVDRYDIDLDYRVETNRLIASTVISARATEDLDRFSLDLAGLVVEKVTIGGERPRKVTQTARKLVITPLAAITAGEEFTVTVRYRGAPHPIRSEWGEVGWEELADGALVASQPNGASSWFPCNDHPSNKARFRIVVSCESVYQVISNGEQVSRTSRAGRARWEFEVAEPMATYLATVQIGRYRALAVDAGVPTTISYPSALSTEVTEDFSRLGEMIALFSDRFGPYPFPAYGVIVTADELEIPLEAHGLAIFGRNHIDGTHGCDRLIAHELAHQWFGNSLTVNRWKDIWLHEGFACYAEWLWSEASGGPTASECARSHWDLVNDQSKDIVVGDPGTKLLFDDRVYKRGALALHVVRRAIGDEAFFDSLRDLGSRLRFGHIMPSDVIDTFAELSHSTAIEGIINRWVYSKALPRLA
ncbi:M1 family metallopeptidase [Glaciihabitans sp. INWT7]|uniref:M1 family metallopeptidase n=1 Tax=Glaciihabitans sp. INWT7 TaxID=2596912 RepID=UPI001627399D|nr:M1 family metallopeptidase [Glaciihabitans sp. INWT7]QNE47311.1 M1 family metallopeptidase [Glaciihabitans sp. INWT7]